MSLASPLKKISDIESLLKAWGRISKRNRLSKGVDKVTIKQFSASLDLNLRGISKDLRAKTYTFAKLRPGTVAKAGSSTPRPIQIPTIRDRVVMKALALHIQPNFAKFDLPCSFAFIAGSDRGVKAAVSRIKELISAGYCYYFEADIKNFFGAVDRDRLWVMFSKQTKQRSLHPLLKQCFDQELGDLESYQLEHQDIFPGASEGIPQGGVLSPMLANFYLHRFDREVTKRGFQLIRYADDFVVMCKTREEANEAHVLCRAELEALGLEIHRLDEPNSKSRFGYFPKDGLSFLGIRFEGKKTYPEAKVVNRLEAKIVELLKPTSGRSFISTMQGLSNLLLSWGRGYQSMDVVKIFLRVDEFVKLQVAQYLRRSGIMLGSGNRGKQMRFLGVPSLVAMADHVNQKSTVAVGHDLVTAT